MSENQKKVDISYFYISKEHNKVLSALIDNGVLGTKEDGIKLGVALGLAFNPSGSLDAKQQSQLSRLSEGLNYNSADFDEDQLITGAISIFTNDFTNKNYRRMMEIAYLGLDLLKTKYFNEDSNVVKWDLIQKDLN
jgi:hypothetical protein